MSSAMTSATKVTRGKASGSAAGARGARGSARTMEEPGTVEARADEIRVLVVDDHPVIHEGLNAQFSIDRRIRIVGRLAMAERLLPEVGRLRPHIVLLDIEMPGPDAFETAARVRNQHPGVRIVVLSAHIRDGYISAAFKAGACGYFSKADALEEIVAGIYDVAAGSDGAFVLGTKVRERCRPLHARHARGAARSAGAPGTSPARGRSDGRSPTSLESLTARETEVLRLIGNGLSRGRIASQLSRSVKTIDAHQEHLMKKLGITTRADLIRFAIREGLVQA
jgi:DNA-binding NarL/FixJ family response regulator